MNHKKALIALLVLAGLIGSSALIAEKTPNHGERLQVSVNLPGCQEVEWNKSMLSDYPWVTDSCHEVFLAEGQVWARFEAAFKGMNGDGTFEVAFLDRQGESTGVISLKPAIDQTVFLDNREHAFSELREDQRLNFYVMEGAYGFAIESLPQNKRALSASNRPRIAGYSRAEHSETSI